jgi:hypothetical protein
LTTATAASNTKNRFTDDSVRPSLDDVLCAIEEGKNLQGDSWLRADLDSFDHSNINCTEAHEWKAIAMKNCNGSDANKLQIACLLWFLFKIICLH